MDLACGVLDFKHEDRLCCHQSDSDSIFRPFHLVIDLLMLVSGGNKDLWLVLPPRSKPSPCPFKSRSSPLSILSLFPLLFIPVRSKTNLDDNPGKLETIHVANFHDNFNSSIKGRPSIVINRVSMSVPHRNRTSIRSVQPTDLSPFRFYVYLWNPIIQILAHNSKFQALVYIS